MVMITTNQLTHSIPSTARWLSNGCRGAVSCRTFGFLLINEILSSFSGDTGKGKRKVVHSIY